MTIKAPRSLTVWLALTANVLVGLLKLAAGLVTGSAALLSEAAHSAGDCVTELLLLVAVHRSARQADRLHPFGYGKERYFWSLLAAFAIFASGGAYSVFEGAHTVAHGGESQHLWINYPVLVLAALLEGTSFLQAMREMRAQSRRRRRSVAGLLRDPEDPTINSVAMEDSAALIGIVLALIGVALHQATGNALWDGLASIAIGLLLFAVAGILVRACRTLVVGKQVSIELLRAIESHLEADPLVDDVVDLLSMIVGTDQVLLCVRADFVDTASAGDLEQACLRLDAELRARFPELGEIFIQPASAHDEKLRERVRVRYGRVLADE